MEKFRPTETPVVRPNTSIEYVWDFALEAGSFSSGDLIKALAGFPNGTVSGALSKLKKTGYIDYDKETRRYAALPQKPNGNGNQAAMQGLRPPKEPDINQDAVIDYPPFTKEILNHYADMRQYTERVSAKINEVMSENRELIDENSRFKQDLAAAELEIKNLKQSKEKNQTFRNLISKGRKPIHGKQSNLIG